MDAKKREMVIKALECCKSGYCYGGCGCPYDDGEDETLDRCTSMLSREALELIKAMAEDYAAYKTISQISHRPRNTTLAIDFTASWPACTNQA